MIIHYFNNFGITKMKKRTSIITLGLVVISILGCLDTIVLGDSIEPQTAFSESGDLDLAAKEQKVFLLNASEGERITVTWDSGDPTAPVTLLIDTSVYTISQTGTFAETLTTGMGTWTNANFTLLNNHTSKAISGTYSVSVATLAGDPEEIPPMGIAGIAIIIAWLAIAGLAVASKKLPGKRTALILLLANVGMIGLWYGGQALAEIPRAGNVVVIGGSEDPLDNPFASQAFTMGENEGLIIYASINFHIDDPICGTINIRITDINELDVAAYTLSICSYEADYESKAAYFDLAPGQYLLFVSEGNLPLERFTLVIKKPGMFADISPVYLGEGIHILFLSLSLLGVIITAIIIKKGGINPE